MHRIYLDHAATTPIHPEVVKAMLPHFTDAFGNPSSIYSYGQEAKGAIEEARRPNLLAPGARRLFLPAEIKPVIIMNEEGGL